MTVVTLNRIDLLTGMIAPFGMSSVPTGWLACDGSAISRATYADLFTAIGTTWGAGDGSSTFALPDLAGAFLRGTGANQTHAKASGESNKFTGPNVGSFEDDHFQGHKHNLNVSNGDGSNPLPGGTQNSLNRSGNGASGDTDGVMVNAINAGANGTPRTGDETQPFNAGVNYCIKY